MLVIATLYSNEGHLNAQTITFIHHYRSAHTFEWDLHQMGITMHATLLLTREDIFWLDEPNHPCSELKALVMHNCICSSISWL